MKEIIFASNNLGKAKELQSILAPTIVISQADFGIGAAEETGLSFVENALIKARFASRILNKPALADDSGLVVVALNGEPGIYSSRYSGNNATDAENNAYLLEKLKTTPPSNRQAYFYCTLVLIQHADDPIPIIATGQWTGIIADHPTGEGGFGYDPIFYVQDYQCTAAQLSPEIKNKISHRAKAMQKLLELI